MRGLTPACGPAKAAGMITARLICTDIAGLRNQALGLAEAAGFVPDLRTLQFLPPWDKIPTNFWFNPRWAVAADAFALPLPPVVMGCGGAGARVAASLRGAKCEGRRDSASAHEFAEI